MIRNVILIIVSVSVSFQISACDNIAHEYLDYFQDVFFHTNLSGISEKCRKIFKNGNFTQTVYFDATAKLPDGLDNGQFYDLGNFDQCYNHVDTADGDEHFGKYCLGFMGIGDSKEFPLIQLHFVVNETFGIYTGFCLSSHCTLEDFSKLFYKHSFTEKRCHSKVTEQKLSAAAWATISIIVAITVVIICSTLYDLTLTYNGRESMFPSLVMFSAIKNGKKIIATTKNPQQILCLCGIRTLSMMWIISHHEFLDFIKGPIGNYYDVVKFYYTPKSMFIHQTPVSVDSFMTLAGILTAYTLMKKQKINLIESYVHRYFRLTPVLSMVILMVSTIYTYVGDGPLWSVSTQVAKDCVDYWWVHLLYLQNYYPMDHCLSQTWYLGVDMQCYIVAVVIMVFLKKSSKIPLTGMGLLISLSAVISFWTCYVYDLPTVRTDYTGKSKDYNSHYYKVTHTRYGPYLIGMLCGYTIYNLKSSPGKHKLPMLPKIIYWIVTVTLLTACIFIPSCLNEDTVWQNALFISLHRLVWSACVSSIILMCVTDNADFVNKFLSLPLFQVLSRLSYCSYIIHVVLISTKVFTTKTVVNFSISRVIVDSWGTIVASLLISIFLSMMFEMPAPDVEKYIIKGLSNIFRGLASAVGVELKVQKTGKRSI